MTLVELMTDAPPNTVVYSEQAWAAARKSQAGRDEWFVDHGAHSASRGALSSAQMVEWTSWIFMVPAP